MEAEMDTSVVTQNMRPSYLADAPDTTKRPSEFDERVRKRLDDELLAEEGGDEEEEETEEVEQDDQRITTFLRIRPISKSIQLDVEAKEMFQIENPHTLVVSHHLRNKVVRDDKTESRFTFTKVLGPDDSQSSVFEECMHPLMDKFFQGENCLVFSYGATNSGKTFTMQGYGVHFGVIPRTLEFLYNRLEECLYKKGNIKPNQVDAYFILDDVATEKLEGIKQKVIKDSIAASGNSGTLSHSQLKSFFSDSLISCSGTSSRMGQIDTAVLSGHSSKSGQAPKQSLPQDSTLYCIWISFAEIYNEKVYDLFDKSGKRKEMKLVQNKQGQVYIQNLTEYCAHSVEEAHQLFQAGKQSLRHAATNMNSNSSRSHSFFNIRMVAVGITGKDVYPKKVLRLTFCDLAGIERVGQTKNVGLRLKESGNINNSLMVLLRCIRAMRDEQNGRTSNSAVLPFRESKLTRLFQSYLTTASRICMIASINPDPQILDSTLQVLQNCAVASDVRTFRRVESPENNTQFCRRVRASIALNASLRMRDNPENSQQEPSGDDESEEDDDDADYNCPTVVSKNPAFTLQKLQSENSELKRKVQMVEIETREKMQKQFDKILADQEASFSQLQQQGRAANQNLNKRRISLAAKCFSEYPAMMCSPIDEDSSESSPSQQNQNDSVRSIVTPEALVMSNHNQQLNNKDNPKQIPYAELMETIRDLQGNITMKNETIDEMEIKLKEMSELSKKLEVLTQRNVDLEQIVENEKNRSETLTQQYKDLELRFVNDSLRYTSRIEVLKTNLVDAEKLCLEYHDSLDSANEQLQDRTKEVNKLYQENQKQAQELEMVNVAMIDMRTSRDALLNELDEADRKISSLENSKRMPRPRSQRKTKKATSSDSDGKSARRTASTASAKKSSTQSRKESDQGKDKENIGNGNHNHNNDSFDITSLDEDEEEEVQVDEWKPKITPHARKQSRPPATPRSLAAVRPTYAGFSPVTDGPSRGRRSLFKKPETINI